MNTADPFAGAFGVAGCNWIGVPDADGGIAPMNGPRLQQQIGPYTGGIFTTVQPGVVQTGGQLTVSNSVTAAATTVTAAATTISVGSNFTMGAMPPEMATPLEVRRYYHWNKSVTAGAAGIPGTTDTPSAPGNEDTAVLDVLVPVSEQREAIRVTESEAVRITEHGNRRRPVYGKVLSPRSLTRVAVFLAGQKRSAVGEEWRRHLLGESDHGLIQREQIRAARGFVWAAVRYRLQDAIDQAWRPVDAVLRSRTWSNLFVLIPSAMVSLFILRNEGTLGAVKSAGSITAIGGIFYGLIRVGRWWRDAKPPEPKVRRVKGE
jgi:hypothetical protein